MNRRHIYFILTGILLILLFVCSFMDNGKPSVVKGYTAPILPVGWQKIIIEEADTLKPEMIVDGHVVPKDDTAPYVSNTLDVMLPIDMVRRGLNCVAVQKSGNMLYFCRGSRKVLVNMQTDEVTVNGETGIIAGAAIRRSDVLYISSKMIADMFDFDLKFDARINEIQFTDQHPEKSFLPEKFTYEEINRIPHTRDQGESGTCWAYSVMTALQSTLLPAEKQVFSVSHMVERTTAGKSGVESGDARMAAAYLLSWQGPVAMEYSAESKKNRDLPVLKHVQGVDIMTDPDIETLKKAVFMKGAVSANIYLAMADAERLTDAENYYSRENCSYYYDGEETVNHEVVIVGWDDGYDRNRFVKKDEVPGDGAFLCLNSWGETFGNNGLFWVSYYDRAFADLAVCISSVERSGNYNRIYQSDLYGATASAGYGSDTAWFAACYTIENDENLAAVGFYTLGNDTAFDIYIVHDFENASDLQNRTPLCAGSFADAGFHTVKLPEEEPFEAGEKAAVIVKIRTPGSEYPVAIEKVTEQIQTTDISDGESYLSSSGKFFKNTESDSACNVCLKLYTNYR